MTNPPDIAALLGKLRAAADDMDELAQAITDAASQVGVAGEYANKRVHSEGAYNVRETTDALEAHIARLEAENAALREGLRPFAEAMSVAMSLNPKGFVLGDLGALAKHHVSANAFRRARSLLSPEAPHDQ